MMQKGILCALTSLSVMSMLYCDKPPKVKECGSGPHPMRVEVRHLEPNGIGFNQGYTTLEGFFSPTEQWADRWIPFLDVRGHIFNNGKKAANAGLGLRYNDFLRVWGFNTYYDYRQTKRQHYNQVAAGFESLGEIWDFRLNGYLPVGRKTSNQYQTQFAYFEDHFAILRRKQQVAMKGANAEAAAHVNTWENYPLYFAAGPYYLNGEGKSAWGGQARAVLGIYEYLKLEGRTSYDHIFKWIGQGEVSVIFPFGKKRNVKGVNCSLELALAERAVQPVDRMEIIPVVTKHKHSAAINPVTGQPYSFWFVNNTSHSNGTFESPANTLTSVSNDVIYVFPGDGTATGMSKGIVLQNNQRLWGSSVDQTLPTSVGTVIVPAMTTQAINGVAMLPILTNTTVGGDVVTLANSNEISGLFLQNSENNAIAGLNNSNLTVLNCAMAGDNIPGASGGIELVGSQGTVTVNNCIFNQTNNGIVFVTQSNAIQATVTNSIFNGPQNGFVWVIGGSAQGTLLFENNTLLTSSDSLDFVQGGNTQLSVNVANNQILATTGDGLSWIAGGMSGTLSFTNNTVQAENQDFLLVQGAGTFAATILNNRMFSASAQGIDAQIGVASTQTNFTIAGNNIYAGLDVITFAQTATHHTLTAVVNDNQLITSSSNGILFNAGGANSSLIASGNTIFGSLSGILLNQTTATNTFALIENNQIQASANQGINLAQLGNAYLSILGNTIKSEFDGVLIDQTAGTFVGTINNNQIESVDASGVDVLASGVSASVSMSGNTLVASAGGSSGLTIDISSGTMNASVTENTFDAFFAVTATMSSSSNTTIDLSNNTVPMGGGFHLETAGTAQALWEVNDNSFTALSSTPVRAINGGTGKVCMQLNNDTAYPIQNAYILTNPGGGTFILNPPQNDIGQISLGGVTIGTCP